MGSLSESVNEKMSHAIENIEAKTSKLEEMIKSKIAESEVVRGFTVELENIQKQYK